MYADKGKLPGMMQLCENLKRRGLHDFWLALATPLGVDKALTRFVPCKGKRTRILARMGVAGRSLRRSGGRQPLALVFEAAALTDPPTGAKLRSLTWRSTPC